MMPRGRGFAAVTLLRGVLVACATLGVGRVTNAQLAVPTTHPGASITQPTSSILLTPAERTSLGTWWASPQAGYQTTRRDSVNATANSGVTAAAPATLAAATTQASIVEAKALRWLASGGGNTSSADFVAVKDVLMNYAKVTGGTAITSPLVSMGYFTAFDFINSGLTPAERSAITTRLNSNVLANLGTATRVNNQYFINNGARGFYALLAGNEANLDSALTNLRSGFNAVTTDDGFFTDGDRYLNYTLGSMPAFLNAYKNGSGDAAGTAQFVNVAEQQARYALGIRMPNGLSPTFHNSDNTPIAIQELSRMVSDPALKAATVWYAEQMGNFDWSSWTNALNNDGTSSDLLWPVDYSAGASAPNWSPTYFSGGQAKISVFRNDWGPSSNYLATIAGIDGNSSPVSFGHHDTGAITLVANGAQVLVEPGYARYNGIGGFGADPAMPNTPAHSTPGPNLNTTLATEHNVLLARDSGTTTWGIGGNGASQALATPDISITHRLDSGERGSFKGVADFSALHSDYTGTGAGANVQTSRSTAMINESNTSAGYFVLADSFRSTSGTNKDFAVNLIGKSTPANTEIMADTSTYKELRWTVTDYFGVTNNGAQASGTPYDAPVSGQVIAHVVSSQSMDSVAADTSWSIDNWGLFIQTQRMRVSVSNVDHGATLTFFETGPANFTSAWTVTPLSGTDFAAARINSTDGWTDWHISQTSATNVHSLAAGATVSIDSGALVSDAQYAYLRYVGSTLDSAMISSGTTLSSVGGPILGTSSPVTASFLFSNMAQGEIRGTLSMDDYVNNSIVTFFNLPGPIESLSYNGVWLNSFTKNSVTLPFVTGVDSVGFYITFAVPEPSAGTLALAAVGCLLTLVLLRKLASRSGADVIGSIHSGD